MGAAVDVDTGKLDTLILPSVSGECMQVFLDEVAARHPVYRIVVILDGAGWNSSLSLKVPENKKLLRVPPYAPQLNPVEPPWDELREKQFHNLAFGSLDALEDHLERALCAMESRHATIQPIVRWPWIINASLN
jgi:transposase